MRKNKVLVMLSVVLCVGVMTSACGKAKTTADNASDGKNNTDVVAGANSSDVKLETVKDGKVTINIRGNSFDFEDEWSIVSSALKKAGGNMSTEKVPTQNNVSSEFIIAFSDANIHVDIKNEAGKIILTSFAIAAKSDFVVKDYTINGITLKTSEADVVKVYGKTPINGNDYLYLNKTTKIEFEKTAFRISRQINRN